MRKQLLKIVLGLSAAVMFFMGNTQLRAGDTSGSTNHPPKLKGIMKDTKVLQADQPTIDKVKAARARMKELRPSSAKNEGPQTVEEAAEYLAKNVSMACPPSACVEYEGVFYFSGGTTTERDTNFLSGFAITKGDTGIHSWEQERKDK